jgi:hypothetical protein
LTRIKDQSSLASGRYDALVAVYVEGVTEDAMLHSVIVFVHVLSAMLIVTAFGIEGLVLLQLSTSTSTRSFVDGLSSFRYVQRVGAAGLIATVLSGIYLAAAYWHWNGAWIGSAFLVVIVIAIIGATMTGRRVTRLRKSSLAPAEGRPAASPLGRDRAVLGASFALRASLLVGIVFLMTVKPSGALALLAIAVSVAIGLALAFSLLRQPRSVGAAQRAET